MSGRPANSRSGIVVGTAGHIDHGKTSLIRALTGMDTDRLAEEKRRGISIDLGFAHANFPGGTCISFVDVPGHERFIKNMLAGAAGIEAVLLVVAADEAVKPQTREHFEICRLLGIRHGIVALTKADIATPSQVSAAMAAVRTLCAGSFLENAPIIPVSALTGEGIPRLQSELSSLANRPSGRAANGLARLPVDRSFALKGFGTVVTGTLWSGQLHAGDTVQIYPLEKSARIRGLQVHGSSIDAARAGERTAVNLAGIDHHEIQRGFVLAPPGAFQTTDVLDLCIRWLDDVKPPTGRAQFLFHSGAAEVSCTLKTLRSGSAGSEALARVWLSNPILAIPGDRFVLRCPSPARTAGGGSVVEVSPPQRISRTRTVQRLQRLLDTGLPGRIRMLVEQSNGGRSLHELAASTGETPDVIKGLILRDPNFVLLQPAQRVVATKWVHEKREKLVEWLREFHAKNPNAAGAPVAAARLGLDAEVAAAVFDGMPEIRVDRDVIALASHRVQFTDQEKQALTRIERVFRAAGFQPPPLADALRVPGLDAKKARSLLEMLVKNHRLVRVSEDLVFHGDVVAHIRNSLAAHKGRRFSVPEFKEWTQISRKYAIPLLEYLDRQHVTRREGDSRVVL